jgi:hypothetical protein
MTELRGNWADLIAGVGLQIAEIFNQAQDEYVPGIFNVLNNVSGQGAQRNITGKTGVGKISLFDDGDDVPGKNRYKTYTTQVVYNNYGGFMEVSANTIEDRNFAADFDEARELSIGANFSQDQSGMQLFNGGFATTTDVNGYRMSWYGDGKPLFSTIHPTTVPGGSTKSNASSTGLVLSYDNMETAYLALIQQQTDDGLPLAMRGKPMLVLPTNLRRKGLEITQSELKPDTANNAINVFVGGMGVDMTTSLFLDSVNGGSSTQWFLVVPGQHKINHETRRAPTLESEMSPKNRTMTFVVSARWANSVTDWRRTWGSKGDGNAYNS